MNKMERSVPYLSMKRDRYLAEVKKKKNDHYKLARFHTQTMIRLSTKRTIGLELLIQLFEESCKIS